MFQPTTNTKGETILETIIALSILAIGITLASTVVGYSLRNINASKNRIVAVNLARQGIEAMRNIRDTNWLKFSGNRRDCWNHDPESDDPFNPDTCNGSTPIAPGRYIIYKDDFNQKWKLSSLELTPSPVTDPPSPNDIKVDSDTAYIYQNDKWVDYRNLYHVDITPLKDVDGDLDFTNDPDIFNHILTEDQEDALGWEGGKRTVFKRSLLIEYLANDPTTQAVNYDPVHNRMRITATVLWQEGKNQFSTELTTHLTDYLGRDRLDG